jgi:chromosome segregation ATPase
MMTTTTTNNNNLEERLKDMELENQALLALRESYKHRFSDEQRQRSRLEDHVSLLKASLEDVQLMNRQLLSEMDHERTRHKQQETFWYHRRERVKRDLDKLWIEYKLSQEQHKEELKSISALQIRLEEYRRKEQSWEKEKMFLTEKASYLHETVKELKQMLKAVKKENS